MQSSWINDDFATFVNWSVGAGRYLSPRLRADVTVDTRGQSELTANGSFAYTTIPGGSVVSGQVSDRTTHDATAAMFNLYYDLTDRGRFTPYIGAGIGFVVNRLERVQTVTETIVAGPGAGTSVTYTGKDGVHEVALAASATAGLAITLWPSTVLDLNYRFMYLGGSDASIPVNGYTSKLTVGETYDHQLRAGLRWNIW
jgi:opacity protein-like surface antigen